MSDSCHEPEFESTGTILYSVLGKGKRKLLFAPDPDHFLKYSVDSYAVFVSLTPPAAKDVREALAVRLRNNEDLGFFREKSVPIEIPCPDDVREVLQVALQAAEQRAKVTVKVKVKRKNESFELVGITFPAG